MSVSMFMFAFLVTTCISFEMPQEECITDKDCQELYDSKYYFCNKVVFRCEFIGPEMPPFEALPESCFRQLDNCVGLEFSEDKVCKEVLLPDSECGIGFGDRCAKGSLCNLDTCMCQQT